eukprot:Skav211844  [mRNA]  locus=scaffold305:821858:822265:+ [translate_table: standard]
MMSVASNVAAVPSRRRGGTAPGLLRRRRRARLRLLRRSSGWLAATARRPVDGVLWLGKHRGDAAAVPCGAKLPLGVTDPLGLWDQSIVSAVHAASFLQCTGFGIWKDPVAPSCSVKSPSGFRLWNPLVVFLTQEL